MSALGTPAGGGDSRLSCVQQNEGIWTERVCQRAHTWTKEKSKILCTPCSVLTVLIICHILGVNSSS